MNLLAFVSLRSLYCEAMQGPMASGAVVASLANDSPGTLNMEVFLQRITMRAWKESFEELSLTIGDSRAMQFGLLQL